MHLLFFYPRHVGNLRLPRPLWGAHNPGDSPSCTGTCTALSIHLEVGRGQDSQPSATTRVPRPPSTMMPLLVSHPLSEGHFSLGVFLFFRELPVHIGAMRSEGSHSPLPPTGPSINKTVIGWGTGRGWTSLTGSETHSSPSHHKDLPLVGTKTVCRLICGVHFGGWQVSPSP